MMVFPVGGVFQSQRVRIDDEFVSAFIERAARPSAVEVSAIDALIVVLEYSKSRVYADRKPMVDDVFIIIIISSFFRFRCRRDGGGIFIIRGKMVADSLPNIFHD